MAYIVRKILGSTGLVNIDSLNLESFNISLSKLEVLNLENIELIRPELEARLQLPPEIKIEHAVIRRLKFGTPYNFPPQIDVLVDGVEIRLQVLDRIPAEKSPTDSSSNLASSIDSVLLANRTPESPVSHPPSPSESDTSDYNDSYLGGHGSTYGAAEDISAPYFFSGMLQKLVDNVKVSIKNVTFVVESDLEALNGLVEQQILDQQGKRVRVAFQMEELQLNGIDEVTLLSSPTKAAFGSACDRSVSLKNVVVSLLRNYSHTDEDESEDEVTNIEPVNADLIESDAETASNRSSPSRPSVRIDVPDSTDMESPDNTLTEHTILASSPSFRSLRSSTTPLSNHFASGPTQHLSAQPPDDQSQSESEPDSDHADVDSRNASDDDQDIMFKSAYDGTGSRAHKQVDNSDSGSDSNEQLAGGWVSMEASVSNSPLPQPEAQLPPPTEEFIPFGFKLYEFFRIGQIDISGIPFRLFGGEATHGEEGASQQPSEKRIKIFIDAIRGAVDVDTACALECVLMRLFRALTVENPPPTEETDLQQGTNVIQPESSTRPLISRVNLGVGEVRVRLVELLHQTLDDTLETTNMGSLTSINIQRIGASLSNLPDSPELAAYFTRFSIDSGGHKIISFDRVESQPDSKLKSPTSTSHHKYLPDISVRYSKVSNLTKIKVSPVVIDGKVSVLSSLIDRLVLLSERFTTSRFLLPILSSQTLPTPKVNVDRAQPTELTPAPPVEIKVQGARVRVYNDSEVELLAESSPIVLLSDGGRLHLRADEFRAWISQAGPESVLTPLELRLGEIATSIDPVDSKKHALDQRYLQVLEQDGCRYSLDVSSIGSSLNLQCGSVDLRVNNPESLGPSIIMLVKDLKPLGRIAKLIPDAEGPGMIIYASFSAYSIVTDLAQTKKVSISGSGIKVAHALCGQPRTGVALDGLTLKWKDTNLINGDAKFSPKENPVLHAIIDERIAVYLSGFVADYHHPVIEELQFAILETMHKCLLAVSEQAVPAQGVVVEAIEAPEPSKAPLPPNFFDIFCSNVGVGLKSRESASKALVLLESAKLNVGLTTQSKGMAVTATVAINTGSIRVIDDYGRVPTPATSENPFFKYTSKDSKFLKICHIHGLEATASIEPNSAVVLELCKANLALEVCADSMQTLTEVFGELGPETIPSDEMDISQHIDIDGMEDPSGEDLKISERMWKRNLSAKSSKSSKNSKDKSGALSPGSDLGDFVHVSTDFNAMSADEDEDNFIMDGSISGRDLVVFQTWENVHEEETKARFSVPKIPLWVKVRNVNVTVHLFGGFDWKSTRLSLDERTKKKYRFYNRAMPKVDAYEAGEVEDEIPGFFVIGDDTKGSNSSFLDSPYTRNPYRKVSVQLTNVCADIGMYEPGKSEVLDCHVRVHQLRIVDRVILTSTWRAFLQPSDLSGASRGPLPTIEANVAVIAPRGRPEVVLEVTVQPLQLNVDQDALDLLQDFGDYKKPGSIEGIPSSSPRFRNVLVHPVSLMLNFKPKRVDFQAMMADGKMSEFANFTALGGAPIKLRRAWLENVDGANQLHHELHSYWMQDVKGNQIQDILLSLAPVRPLAGFAKGGKTMMQVTRETYLKTGDIPKSVIRGARKSMMVTATELLRTTALATAGTSKFARRLNPKTASERSLDGFQTADSKASQYSAQPMNIIAGLQKAAQDIIQGAQSTRKAVAAFPEDMNERGLGAALARGGARTALGPTTVILTGLSSILFGLSNQLDPKGAQEWMKRY